MEEYTCMIPRDTHDGAFYRAVLALHQDLFSLAQQVGYITAHKYTQCQRFPPIQCTLKVYIFRKHLIKTCHMGIRLASWFLEFSLVFIARYEKLKSLETNTAKKHKNGFTAIPDRIEFPHQHRLFIKRNKMDKVCLFFVFFFFYNVVPSRCGNVM